ncbi:MAG: glycine/betaine ABC transporter [Candidatus Melainabacteria bacterium HGW-Melainabacteria-1]|nr:MAG: glycine/betaine ABC transporter [Candidatus Melainabacteria bacterium HGW-Melainabacteria-1]
MIRLKSVSKSYAGRCVVDEVSFTLPAGQILCLIGSSGSGKTTTLRMLNRLVEPDSGQIEIDGEDILSIDKIRLRRRIGYVIQQIGLLPHLSVARNIALLPEIEGWSKSRIQERVDELLRLMQLEPETFRLRYPAALSGGQQQRVGVARALALSPPIMLLDEPFAALDPITRAQLQDSFLHLQRRLGITVVLVTHDLAEAFKCGDLIGLMHQGRLLQMAPPLAYLRHAESEFVADFVRGAVSKGQLLDLPASRLAGSLDACWQLDDEGRPLGWCNEHGELQHDFALLQPNASLRDALRLLLGRPLPGLPLVDAEGRAIGQLTAEGLAQLL